MLHVLCTIVIILGDGTRDVRRLEGFEVGERGDKLIVDFAQTLDQEPTTRYVNNNDCLYLQDPVAGYRNMLNAQAEADRQAELDRAAWHKLAKPKAK
jgi:hypothetical protein